jgi:hypothetical protein
VGVLFAVAVRRALREPVAHAALPALS